MAAGPLLLVWQQQRRTAAATTTTAAATAATATAAAAAAAATTTTAAAAAAVRHVGEGDDMRRCGEGCAYEACLRATCLEPVASAASSSSR